MSGSESSEPPQLCETSSEDDSVPSLMETSSSSSDEEKEDESPASSEKEGDTTVLAETPKLSEEMNKLQRASKSQDIALRHEYSELERIIFDKDADCLELGNALSKFDAPSFSFRNVPSLASPLVAVIRAKQDREDVVDCALFLFSHTMRCERGAELMECDGESGLTPLHAVLIMLPSIPDFKEVFKAIINPSFALMRPEDWIRPTARDKHAPYSSSIFSLAGFELLPHEVPTITGLRRALACMLDADWDGFLIVLDAVEQILKVPWSPQGNVYANWRYDTPWTWLLFIRKNLDNKYTHDEASRACDRLLERLWQISDDPEVHLASEFWKALQLKSTYPAEVFQSYLKYPYDTKIGIQHAASVYQLCTKFNHPFPDTNAAALRTHIVKLVNEYNPENGQGTPLITETKAAFPQEFLLLGRKFEVHNLVRHGEVSQLEEILSIEGVSPNTVSITGYTPIMLAVMQLANTAVAQAIPGVLNLLISHGARVDDVCQANDMTPLMLACDTFHKGDSSCEEVIKCLILNGADLLTAKSSVKRTKISPLEHAMKQQVHGIPLVRLLCSVVREVAEKEEAKKEECFNASSLLRPMQPDGSTCLHRLVMLVRQGSVEADIAITHLKHLINTGGADPALKNSEGRTAEHVADSSLKTRPLVKELRRLTQEFNDKHAIKRHAFQQARRARKDEKERQRKRELKERRRLARERGEEVEEEDEDRHHNQDGDQDGSKHRVHTRDPTAYERWQSDMDANIEELQKLLKSNTLIKKPDIPTSSQTPGEDSAKAGTQVSELDSSSPNRNEDKVISSRRKNAAKHMERFLKEQGEGVVMDQHARLDEASKDIVGQAWELEIIREARDVCFGLPVPLRLHLLTALRRLARGDHVLKKDNPGQSAHSFLKAVRQQGVEGQGAAEALMRKVFIWKVEGPEKCHGRLLVLWERAVVYSNSICTYTECVRIWSVLHFPDTPPSPSNHIDQPQPAGSNDCVNSHNKEASRPSNTKLASPGPPSKGCGDLLKERMRLATLAEVMKIAQSHEKGRKSLHIHRLREVTLPAGRNSIDQSETTVELPKKFTPVLEGETEIQGTTGLARGGAEVVLCYPPAVPSEGQYTLQKFYQVSWGLARCLANTKAGPKGVVREFPFRVSATEHAFIALDRDTVEQRPTLLLGRSGTGKTTCIVLRIWERYLAYWKSTPVSTPPLEDRCVDVNGRQRANVHMHQVFVTSNPVLRAEVAKFFQAVRVGHGAELGPQTSFLPPLHPAVAPPGDQDLVEDGGDGEAGDGGGAGGTRPGRTAALHSLLPECVHEGMFPLFLTRRELLVAVDGTLDDPFFRRVPGGMQRLTDEAARLAWGAQGRSGLSSIFEVAGEGEEDIPEEDEDVESADGSLVPRESVGPGKTREPGGGKEGKMPRVEVDYEYFHRELWKDIGSKSQLNPALVWSEIVSFIKGSMDSLARPSGFLSLDEYRELGRKRSPNYQSKRNEVYGIFQKYEAHKSAHNGFDLCDLVRHIHCQLAETGYRGTPIHSTFVDEVQDFTEAEISVLLRVSCSPNAFFLSGDTAQTIAKGLAFRFSDLRSLFWRQAQSCPGAREVKCIHKLLHNYRTHTGVLEAANLVVELIEHFFPGDIDKLQHDRGLFRGPKPTLLSFTSLQDLYSLLLGGVDRDKDSLTEIELGAQQVVIVRDSAAKARLPSDLARGALVCTVGEAKGLEFDDVLLWNFCTDSEFNDTKTGENWWRVVKEYTHQNQDVTASGESEEHCGEVEDNEVKQAKLEAKVGCVRGLEFSSSAHRVLLDELRHLYTALTRARVRVYMYEQDNVARAPLWDLLIRRKLVEVESVVVEGNEGAGEGSEGGGGARLQSGGQGRGGMGGGLLSGGKSSPEEWRERGNVFLRRGAYSMAAQSFHKAGDTFRQAHAEGWELYSSARSLPASSPERRLALQRAALRFLHSRAQGDRTGLSNAALCCRLAGEYLRAGRLLEILAETYDCTTSQGGGGDGGGNNCDGDRVGAEHNIKAKKRVLERSAKNYKSYAAKIQTENPVAASDAAEHAADLLEMARKCGKGVPSSSFPNSSSASTSNMRGGDGSRRRKDSPPSYLEDTQEELIGRAQTLLAENGTFIIGGGRKRTDEGSRHQKRLRSFLEDNKDNREVVELFVDHFKQAKAYKAGSDLLGRAGLLPESLSLLISGEEFRLALELIKATTATQSTAHDDDLSCKDDDDSANVQSASAVAAAANGNRTSGKPGKAGEAEFSVGAVDRAAKRVAEVAVLHEDWHRVERAVWGFSLTRDQEMFLRTRLPNPVGSAILERILRAKGDLGRLAVCQVAAGDLRGAAGTFGADAQTPASLTQAARCLLHQCYLTAPPPPTQPTSTIDSNRLTPRHAMFPHLPENEEVVEYENDDEAREFAEEQRTELIRDCHRAIRLLDSAHDRLSGKLSDHDSSSAVSTETLKAELVQLNLLRADARLIQADLESETPDCRAQLEKAAEFFKECGNSYGEVVALLQLCNRCMAPRDPERFVFLRDLADRIFPITLAFCSALQSSQDPTTTTSGDSNKQTKKSNKKHSGRRYPKSEGKSRGKSLSSLSTTSRSKRSAIPRPTSSFKGENGSDDEYDSGGEMSADQARLVAEVEAFHGLVSKTNWTTGRTELEFDLLGYRALRLVYHTREAASLATRSTTTNTSAHTTPRLSYRPAAFGEVMRQVTGLSAAHRALMGELLGTCAWVAHQVTEEVEHLRQVTEKVETALPQAPAFSSKEFSKQVSRLASLMASLAGAEHLHTRASSCKWASRTDLRTLLQAFHSHQATATRLVSVLGGCLAHLPACCGVKAALTTTPHPACSLLNSLHPDAVTAMLAVSLSPQHLDQQGSRGALATAIQIQAAGKGENRKGEVEHLPLSSSSSSSLRSSFSFALAGWRISRALNNPQRFTDALDFIIRQHAPSSSFTWTSALDPTTSSSSSSSLGPGGGKLMGNRQVQGQVQGQVPGQDLDEEDEDKEVKSPVSGGSPHDTAGEVVGTRSSLEGAEVYLGLTACLPGTEGGRDQPLLHCHRRLQLLETLVNLPSRPLPSPCHCLWLLESVLVAAILARAPAVPHFRDFASGTSNSSHSLSHSLSHSQESPHSSWHDLLLPCAYVSEHLKPHLQHWSHLEWNLRGSRKTDGERRLKQGGDLLHRLKALLPKLDLLKTQPAVASTTPSSSSTSPPPLPLTVRLVTFWTTLLLHVLQTPHPTSPSSLSLSSSASRLETSQPGSTPPHLNSPLSFTPSRVAEHIYAALLLAAPNMRSEVIEDVRKLARVLDRRCNTLPSPASVHTLTRCIRTLLTPDQWAQSHTLKDTDTEWWDSTTTSTVLCVVSVRCVLPSRTQVVKLLPPDDEPPPPLLPSNPATPDTGAVGGDGGRGGEVQGCEYGVLSTPLLSEEELMVMPWLADVRVVQPNPARPPSSAPSPPSPPPPPPCPEEEEEDVDESPRIRILPMEESDWSKFEQQVELWVGNSSEGVFPWQDRSTSSIGPPSCAEEISMKSASLWKSSPSVHQPSDAALRHEAAVIVQKQWRRFSDRNRYLLHKETMDLESALRMCWDNNEHLTDQLGPFTSLKALKRSVHSSSSSSAVVVGDPCGDSAQQVGVTAHRVYLARYLPLLETSTDRCNACYKDFHSPGGRHIDANVADDVASWKLHVSIAPEKQTHLNNVSQCFRLLKLIWNKYLELSIELQIILESWLKKNKPAFWEGHAHLCEVQSVQTQIIQALDKALLPGGHWSSVGELYMEMEDRWRRTLHQARRWCEEVIKEE